MRLALRHEEPDRVPVSDFFWQAFVERWRRDLGLVADADIYTYYDLDWVVTTPNMDPLIKQFELLHEDDSEVVVRTGFEAVMRKKFGDPMPESLRWDTDSIEKLEAFDFDDPADGRRFLAAGDNHIAGVGDTFVRNSPAWIETVTELRRDFAVFGSVIEPCECLTRLIGQSNALLWIGLHPGRMGGVIERIGDFYTRLLEAQIEAAGGSLDGMVIWGDVAYRKAMFFSPAYWRRFFKPVLRRMIEICHLHDLPVIYHACGNVNAIIADLVEIKLDCLNPLEAKAGLDAVELRRKYGHRLAFCGNMDVTTWPGAGEDELRALVLSKLNAAKGGGFIFASDHSVPDNVPGSSYDYVIKTLRRHGTYPLDLCEFDLPEVK